MVRLLSIDLDGTLLNEKSQLSRRNREALSSAVQNGMEVVINTGRAYFDAKGFFDGLDFCPWIIGSNGATIHTPAGAALYSLPIERESVGSILAWLERESLYYEVFSSQTIYSLSGGRDLITAELEQLKKTDVQGVFGQVDISIWEDYLRDSFFYIRSYEQLLSLDAELHNIMVFSFFEEKLNRVYERYAQQQSLSIVKSSAYNYQLAHVDSSKGNGLSYLAGSLGIPLKETAAIGDHYNDLSMLRIAGRSVAMGNAEEAVKAACQEIILPNYEDGVAHFIENLITSK